jgi:hypothetical protein
VPVSDSAGKIGFAWKFSDSARSRSRVSTVPSPSIARDLDRQRRLDTLAAAPRLPPLQHHIGAMQRAIDRDLVTQQARYLVGATFEDSADFEVLEAPRLRIAPAIDHLGFDAIGDYPVL